MASNSETRILHMRINNKDFLKGAAESVRSLDLLNKSIGVVAKGKGMGDLAKKVDEVKLSFSTLTVMATTAIANITNRAVNAGINLAKSFTVTPIMDGWREYEKLLTSTQTIVANTGKELEKFDKGDRIKIVGSYLDSLNAYADQTVYNFGQMADNIGKFTASGVKLAPAVDAIKGMANAAALFGSDANQLNTAMYQMSQALATGTIKLMDWNSLVNAGMGGENMQTTLKATAHTFNGLGGSMEKSIKKAGSFRESLKDGWLTAEVFTKAMKVMGGQALDATTSMKTLEKMGLSKATREAIKAGDAFKFTTKDIKALKEQGFDDASIGAMEMGKSVAYTVEQLQGMGYTKQAAKDLARLSADALESATKIKTFTQLIDVLKESIGSGWASIFRSLFGDLEQAGKMWTTVGNVLTGGIEKVFYSVSLLLGKWRQLGGYEKLWGGFGNIFKAIGNILRPFVKMIQALLPSANVGGSALYGLSAAFYAITAAIEKATRVTHVLDPVFKVLRWTIETLGAVVWGVIRYFWEFLMLFKPLGQGIVDVIGYLNDLFTSFGGLFGWVKDITGGLIDLTDLKGKIDGLFDGLISAREAIFAPIIAVVVGLGEALGSLFKGDFNLFEKKFAFAFSPLEAIGAKLQSAGKAIQGFFASLGSTGVGWIDATVGTLFSLGEVISGLGDKLSDTSFSMGWAKSITEALARSGEWLSETWAKVRETFSGWESSMTFFSSLGDILGGLFTQGVDNAGKAIENFNTTGEKVKNTGIDLVEVWGKITDFFKAAGTEIGAALGLIGDGGEAVGGMFGKIFEWAKGLDRLDIANMFSVIFSGGVIYMIWKIKTTFEGFLDTFKTTAKTFGSASNAFEAMTNQLKTMEKGVKAKAILNIAIAVGILAASIWLLSRIDPKQLAIGIGGLALVLALLVNNLSKVAAIDGKMSIVAMAGSLVLMAGAMIVLSGAVIAFGLIPMDVLAKGILAMSVSMAALIGAAILLSKASPWVILGAAAMVILAGALTLMSGVILLFAAIPLDKLQTGLQNIVGSMLAMSLSLIALGVAGPMVLVAAAALLVVQFALLGMLGVITAFAAVSWETLGSGIAKIAAAIIAIGLAGVIAAPGLILLGIGLSIIGAGMLAIGLGLSLAAAGLALIAVVGVGAGIALGLAVESFLLLLPMMGTQMVAALVAILEAIADASPRIIDSLVTIGTELLRGLVELGPEVAAAAISLLGDFLDALVESRIMIFEAGVDLIVGFLEALEEGSEDIIDAGVALIETFLEGIGDAAGDLVTAAGETILDFLNAINMAVEIYMPQIIEAGQNIAGNLIDGLVQGLIPEPIRTAFSTLVDNVLGFFRGLLGINSPSTVFKDFGGDVIDGLVNGVKNGYNAVKGAISDLVTKVVDTVKGLPGKASNALGSLKNKLKEKFGSAFESAKTTVTTKISNIMSAISGIPGKISAKVSSIKDSAKKIGGAILDGIKNGLKAVGGFVTDMTRSIKNAINDALGLPKRLSFKAGKGPFKVDLGFTIPAFAKGTDYFRQGGTALVGEAGPELVSMRKGSAVITNKNLVGFMKSVKTLTRAMAAGRGDYRSNDRLSYVVDARFKGDPKRDGIAFAANIASGLILGLNSKQTVVNQTMSDFGGNAAQSFADILGIRSPSKVFEKYAGYVGQGFINGLVASVDAVKAAAVAMATAATDIVSETITENQLRLESMRAEAEALRYASKNTRLSKSERSKLAKQADAADKAVAEQQKRTEEENAALERQAKFEESDAAGKAQMRNEDALTSAKKASEARQKAIALSKEADLIMKKDKAKAKKLDADAAKALADAQKFANESEAYAKESLDYNAEAKLAEQGDIQAQVSSVSAADVLAAQASFNQYAKLLADAYEAASSAPTQVTYNQHLTSPEAISPSEAYRHGKNLVSIMERKLVDQSS